MFINLKNFKNKLCEMLDRYSDLKEVAKEKIIEQATSDLAGYRKKEIVDTLLINGLKTLKGKHKIIDFIIEYFISKVPYTTQKIYDQLKAKVSGITK